MSGCDAVSDLIELLPSRAFYSASTVMEPTLATGETMMADKVSPGEVRRGDILIVTHPLSKEDYVTRLIALPGDTVAVTDGVIVLNGERIDQRDVGLHRYTDEAAGREVEVRRFRERLPDSDATYDVLDSAVTPGDTFGPLALGPDQYFFMGDNRDNSADSRFPADMRGLGLVKGDQITRRVDLSSVGN
ncbi:MAG: signal peptidase I [Pseudomonadota bacterium]